MTGKRVGKITIPGGIIPEPHELAIANIFALSGKDVTFIKPRRMKGSKNPDVKINGVLWEMKSPMGKSKKTVANALRRAVKQSRSVIIDAHHIQISDDDVTKELLRNVPLTKSLKRLIMITKTNKVIVLK